MNNPRIIERNNKRQFDDLMLGSIELFCLAAELESFTDAATAAGVTPAAVSRAIVFLEAHHIAVAQSAAEARKASGTSPLMRLPAAATTS
jgi:hypothetical protein